MTLIDKIDFENKKVLIIGEASVDKYIIGAADRISPDAPVPNIKVEENLNYIGGIGLAVQFIKSLGGIPQIRAIIGNDFEGDFFLKKINELNIDSSGILIDESINTPQITRIKAMNQHILRLETDYSFNISDKIMKDFFKLIETSSREVDSILILNYGIGGLFTDVFTQKLLLTLKKYYNNIPIIARPDLSNYYIYEGIDLMRVNLQKALLTFSIDCCNETSISIAGKKILNSSKCKNLLLSYLDSESYLFSKETEKVEKYSPMIQNPVRGYVAVGSVIMAILSLTYAINIPVKDGVKIALSGATLSACLPPVEFFNSKKLKDFISNNLKE